MLRNMPSSFTIFITLKFAKVYLFLSLASYSHALLSKRQSQSLDTERSFLMTEPNPASETGSKDVEQRPKIVTFTVTQYHQKQSLCNVKYTTVTISNLCINMTISVNRKKSDEQNMLASIRHLEFR